MTRLDLLVEQLAEHNLDAFLVSALPNIEYLSGFMGSNGLLLVSGGRPVLLTDPRYEIQAPEQTGCQVKVARGDLFRTAAVLMRRKRWKRIGFEASRLAYDSYQAVSEALPAGVELVPTRGMVEQLRAIKSPDEIERIRRSAQTCSKAFTRVARRPGVVT